MSSKTFEEASEQVRHLMEVAGGSCDAYAPPPAPEQPKKSFPSWEEVSSKLLHTEPEPVATRTSPDWVTGQNFSPAEKNDEPSRDELDEFIRESLGANPAPKEEPAPPTPENEPGQEEILCAGSIQEYRGESAFEPITDEYKLLGSVEDAGELADIYYAFQDASLDPKSVVKVAMDTGIHELTTVTGSGTRDYLELVDDVKGLRYVRADLVEMSRYAPIVEKGDLLIWVIPTPEFQQGPDDHLGYIHNGFAYLRKP